MCQQRATDLALPQAASEAARAAGALKRTRHNTARVSKQSVQLSGLVSARPCWEGGGEGGGGGMGGTGGGRKGRVEEGRLISARRRIRVAAATPLREGLGRARPRDTERAAYTVSSPQDTEHAARPMKFTFHTHTGNTHTVSSPRNTSMLNLVPRHGAPSNTGSRLVPRRPVTVCLCCSVSPLRLVSRHGARGGASSRAAPARLHRRHPARALRGPRRSAPGGPGRRGGRACLVGGGSVRRGRLRRETRCYMAVFGVDVS
jgi:hypothetical protein